MSTTLDDISSDLINEEVRVQCAVHGIDGHMENAINQFMLDLREAVHFNTGADSLSGVSAAIFPEILMKLEAVCSNAPSHRDEVGTSKRPRVKKPR